jgi:CDP-diacylglycerol--glycerol-3-phosphate 3-phosphatidyltransferase
MSNPPILEPKPNLTDRLRILTKGIIDPIVTLLARLHVSPDALTILGMSLHFLYAWLIANGHMIFAGIAILVFIPLDALDGSLARKIGRIDGNFGAFLDSTSDRIAEIILFAGYIYYYGTRDDLWLTAAAYLALTGSIMVSYTRSRAEALGLSCKVGILTRVERYVVIVVTLVIDRPEWGLVILAIGTYFTFLQRVLHVRQQAKIAASGDATDAQGV